MGAKRGTERENQLLVAAGFESTDEEEDLWTKEGVWYGRNAALQSARRTLRATTGTDVLDEEAFWTHSGVFRLRPAGFVVCTRMGIWVSEKTSSRQFVDRGTPSSRCTLAATVEVPSIRKLLGDRGFGQKVGIGEMKGVMLGYWVILVGIVFDVVGTVWDAIDDLTGEVALRVLLTPERLKLLGIAIAILGLFLGLRMGLRRQG
jgi:hypothetical protein